MKNLIFAICFLMVSCLPINIKAEKSTKKFINVNKINKYYQTSDYTYELVFKDGIWWIFVYDEDGVFVTAYPSE
ncbi:MAG TPA: hypothetical protein PK294_12865 [Ignavibacteria bacterium]|nr:hypothetical protein [Ignavibacteria bacterium]HQY51955.1 hypothetical protein [Ignavibacteria bacterium]HRB01318.1 hypothetical protein [Ignavibacteria bacterium]